MSSILAKKDELDLIRSIFTTDELIFSNPVVVNEFDSLAYHGLLDDDKPIQLTLRLAFPELSVDVSLTIDLPIGYPVVAPSILLRLKQSQPTVNEKSLNSAFHGWLSEAIVAGEPIICSAVDWLQNALNDNTETYARHAHNDSTKCGDVEAQPIQSPEICYWIFSHHIRNPKKRKVIVDWARELHLTGCCLPGKPGIVVAEGTSDKVEEYWKRIRVLTWKRIQVKDREVIEKRRFMDGFFEVGGSLADKIQYMRDHGVSQERIAAHFGFKVDESDNK